MGRSAASSAASLAHGRTCPVSALSVRSCVVPCDPTPSLLRLRTFLPSVILHSLQSVVGLDSLLFCVVVYWHPRAAGVQLGAPEAGAAVFCLPGSCNLSAAASVGHRKPCFEVVFLVEILPYSCPAWMNISSVKGREACEVLTWVKFDSVYKLV